MTTKKPGPSPEYRDLLNGRISPDEYVTKMKRAVDARLNNGSVRHAHPRPA